MAPALRMTRSIKEKLPIFLIFLFGVMVVEVVVASRMFNFGHSSFSTLAPKPCYNADHKRYRWNTVFKGM